MKDNSAIFVIVISLFIIIFIIISYYILSDSMFKKININPEITIHSPTLSYNNSPTYSPPYYPTYSQNNSHNNSQNNSQNYSQNNSQNYSPTIEDEVFHLRENKYNYEEAQAVCKAYNSRLATLDELKDSYSNGANWCNYGWSDEQLALYPTQIDYWESLQDDPITQNQCGIPGVNGGYYKNEFTEFGANCYGQKPNKKHTEEETKPKTNLELLAEKYKVEIDSGKIKVAPFNETNWYK